MQISRDHEQVCRKISAQPGNFSIVLRMPSWTPWHVNIFHLSIVCFVAPMLIYQSTLFNPFEGVDFSKLVSLKREAGYLSPKFP